MKHCRRTGWSLLVVAAICFATPAWAENGITDIGTLPGEDWSTARGVSADGSVVVGEADAGTWARAFRWTQADGMTSLGVIGGDLWSAAYDVSADGSVIVGMATEQLPSGNWERAFRWTAADGMQKLTTDPKFESSYAFGVSEDGSVIVGRVYETGMPGQTAFRWTEAGGMVSLGTLNNGNNSAAQDVSADGSVVVGYSSDGNQSNAQRAFRWTQATGMTSLGVLGGDYESYAYGVSADGNVVAGSSWDTGRNVSHAFRWTQAAGMQSLGFLNGGTYAWANGISGNGAVVVGYAGDGNAGNITRAMRWTQSTGMQTVEDWLRDSGVTVSEDITNIAYATNSDGSVVVGSLVSQRAFIARGSSGLVTPEDIEGSLNTASHGRHMVLANVDTMLHGAHSRPLSRRVEAGKNVFWLAGDWGRDDHDSRDGDLGLAEVGLGRNFGPAQINVSLGRTWADQDLSLDGRTEADGTYLLGEVLFPIAGNLWATLGGYGHWGNADLRRGYLNAGANDHSTGNPDVDTLGVRARLDWENAAEFFSTGFTPYADLSYREAKMESYTEKGGGFPAHFNSAKESVTDLRLGVNANFPLTNETRLLGTLEATHRFDEAGADTEGQLVGLFGFDIDGSDYDQDWVRAGAGVETQLLNGTASLMVNFTSEGEMPNAWVTVSYQIPF